MAFGGGQAKDGKLLRKPLQFCSRCGTTHTDMAQLSYFQWFHFLSCLALGFFASVGVIAATLKWVAHGGHRTRGDFHHGSAVAIPRLGGLAIAVSFALVAAVIYLFGGLSPEAVQMLAIISLSSLAMFLLGFCDDLFPLNAKFKLNGQILIASGVWFCNLRIDALKNPFTDQIIHLGLVGYFVTVVWIVSLTNLINLVDGIDGLAGGICLMLMFLLANLGMGGDGITISALLAAGVAGALLGFLRSNYPPAKIYMGDGGAYFLGFLIAILSIVSSNKGTVVASLIAPAFALALPIVDVSLALLRRGSRGLPLFRPDRKHIHHRLITLGISRERTLLNLYTVSLLCLILAVSICYVQGRYMAIFAGLLFLVLLGAGHLSGLTRDWFRVGSQIGKSLALRESTKYSLNLSSGLVMGVDRKRSARDIWTDYGAAVEKLGFALVVVILPDGTSRCWKRDTGVLEASDLRHAEHDMPNGTTVKLDASKAIMDESQFDLLGDLAAETWFAVTARWLAVNKAPFHFDDASAPGACLDSSAAS
jgi:UDP-GlcNAc:undecaprenyl-phosphate GlcNAc-1-phosphate transferase